MVLDSIRVQVNDPDNASSTIVTDDPSASIISSEASSTLSHDSGVPSSSPSPSTSPDNASDNDEDGASTGMIAGAVVGGLAGVALLVFAAYMLFWRRRKNQESAFNGNGEARGMIREEGSSPAPLGNQPPSPAFSSLLPHSVLYASAGGQTSQRYRTQSSNIGAESSHDPQNTGSASSFSLAQAHPIPQQEVGSNLTVRNDSGPSHNNGQVPLGTGEYASPPPMHVEVSILLNFSLTVITAGTLLLLQLQKDNSTSAISRRRQFSKRYLGFIVWLDLRLVGSWFSFSSTFWLFGVCNFHHNSFVHARDRTSSEGGGCNRVTHRGFLHKHFQQCKNAMPFLLGRYDD